MRRHATLPASMSGRGVRTARGRLFGALAVFALPAGAGNTDPHIARSTAAMTTFTWTSSRTLRSVRLWKVASGAYMVSAWRRSSELGAVAAESLCRIDSQ